MKSEVSYKNSGIKNESDNSDHKNVEGKYSQINKVVVSQELECGGDKKGVNKD
jgi:hypothetical protein